MHGQPQTDSQVISTIRSIYVSDLLANRVALVTGASRGLGRAVALAYGALGAQVIVNYAGNEKEAQATVAQIAEHGGRALAVRFDVSHFQDVQDAIKQLEKEHGVIGILVNNAGVSRDNLLVRYREDEWNQTVDTNLKGAFNCARAVSMGMLRARSGKIINISSVVGLTGNAGQCAYAASKAGLVGLTKAIALELAAKNVQVNAIAPGYIESDMTKALGEDVTKKISEKIPQGKMGYAVEIAKAAVFLASSASDYVTGQTLSVDGGMVMR